MIYKPELLYDVFIHASGAKAEVIILQWPTTKKMFSGRSDLISGSWTLTHGGGRSGADMTIFIKQMD